VGKCHFEPAIFASDRTKRVRVLFELLKRHEDNIVWSLDYWNSFPISLVPWEYHYLWVLIQESGVEFGYEESTGDISRFIAFF
jgi:hypothetical protein